MKEQNKIGRKKFFKYLFYSLSIPLVLTWKKLVDSNSFVRDKQKEVTLPLDIPNGISMSDSVLIYRDENNLNFYSAKCSHLGCKITKVESEEFVCPCHGSRFDINGNVKEGPAYKPLTRLDYTINKNNGTVSIVLDA